MSVMTRLCILSSVLVVSCPALADYGRGYIATDMDPQTHEFREVVKDWQEGVVLDPASGNYIVTYKSDGSYSQTVFEPATKILPVVKSKYRPSADSTDTIQYEFLVKNDRGAKQRINVISTEISSLEPDSLVDPAGWHSTFLSNESGANSITWFYVGRGRAELLKEEPQGLAPTARLAAFAFQSDDLPGIATMKLQGDHARTTWLGGPPDVATPVGHKVEELKAHNFVSRFVVVPKLAVSNPLDAGTVLDALRAHITNDLTRFKLVDSVLADQLDRVLQAAANAARRNQVDATRDLLHDAFQLLHRARRDVDDADENDDTEGDLDGKMQKAQSIDRRAARAIAFDINYVDRHLPGKRDTNFERGRDSGPRPKSRSAKE